MRQTTAPQRTPSPQVKGGNRQTAGHSQASLFFGMAWDMSWQLALVVLIPIIGGHEIDLRAQTSPIFLIVGFIVAMLGMALVMWRTLQTANRLPVPKLTAAQKRSIRQSYDEDDDQ